jgi:hypothetical protein
VGAIHVSSFHCWTIVQLLQSLTETHHKMQHNASSGPKSSPIFLEWLNCRELS